MDSEINAVQAADSLSELSPAESPKALKNPQRKSRRLPPLLRLTRRAVVFLSLTLIATILFFMMGNQQNFLDSNLILILKIIASNAIALSFFSFTAISECIFYATKNKQLRFVVHLVCYILVLALSLTISVLSLSINLLSEGITF